MKIGIAYSLAPPAADRPPDGPDDRYEEFDKPETVEAIAAAIRADGHDVALLGDGREFLTRVLVDPPAFVFNIAEGEGVGRSREARVPAACEMLGIPYSGSDPWTMATCLDKWATRRVVALRYVHASTPYDRHRGDVGRAWLLPAAIEAGVAELAAAYDDPATEVPRLIFKPACEGSSKGIRGTCLADRRDEAIATYRRLAEDYRQPILAEEFIDGEEITVGLVGNGGGRGGDALGEPWIMRIVPNDRGEPFVYSLEVKRDWQSRVTYEAPALLPEAIGRAIAAAAVAAFEALDCRDFARIDFRVRDGVPYFIEANPLPGLAPGTSDLVIMAERYGIGYGELVRKILKAALARVGLA